MNGPLGHICCSCTLHMCTCAWELVSHHRLLVFVNISFLFFSFEFYLMTNLQIIHFIAYDFRFWRWKVREGRCANSIYLLGIPKCGARCQRKIDKIRFPRGHRYLTFHRAPREEANHGFVHLSRIAHLSRRSKRARRNSRHSSCKSLFRKSS